MSAVRQRKHADAGEEIQDHDNEPGSGLKHDDDNPADHHGSAIGVFGKLAVALILATPLFYGVYWVYGVPSPIQPVTVSIGVDQPPLTGKLTPNNLLVEQGTRHYEGVVIGPESLTLKDGFIFTGTYDGKILRIDHSQGKIHVVATLGTPPCGRPDLEETCGRPLGLRFDPDGYLIVLDAYLGMYQVNVATGGVTQLFSNDMVVDGRSFNFLNDLDIASDGTIYFTDSSKYQRRHFPFDFLEGTASGRLLKYNPIENTTETLLDDLYFANGVQISRDGSFLLVSETTKWRIQKYYLTGPKIGQSEVFADNMPGIVDNIRASSSGGFWAVLGVCRYEGRFSFFDALGLYPGLRKQLAKLPMKYISYLFPECVIIMELSEDGRVLQSLMDLHGQKFAHISEAEEHDGLLYLGSYRSLYIGVVQIPGA